MLYLFSFFYFYFSLAYGVMNKAWLAFTLKAAKQIFFFGVKEAKWEREREIRKGRRMERKASFFLSIGQT